MADIFPFNACRYSTAVAGDLGQVVTQPYDKITPAMQDRYYEQSPYNLVRVILRKPAGDALVDDYAAAASSLREWIQAGALVRDARPSFYAAEQTFRVPGSESRWLTRRGVIALARVEDYEAQVVFPHEKTLDGPKKDRLQLLRATRAHCEQLFMLYRDPSRVVDRLIEEAALSAPLIEIEDEYGVKNRLWAITDPQEVETIQLAFKDKKLLIADGHHRYETALAYRNECRRQLGERWRSDHSSERVMVTLVNSESEGLVILPTHRVVEHLVTFDLPDFLEKAGAYFEISEGSLSDASDSENFARGLASGAPARPAIGCVVREGRQFIFRCRSNNEVEEALRSVPSVLKRLDVVLLHELLLRRCLGLEPHQVSAGGNIRYFREAPLAIDEVRSGRAQAVFLLNPIRIQQVQDAAFAGVTLPQKSTDFYPKLLSGLTLYTLE